MFNNIILLKLFNFYFSKDGIVLNHYEKKILMQILVNLIKNNSILPKFFDNSPDFFFLVWTNDNVK